jgi:hypothetical protein
MKYFIFITLTMLNINCSNSIARLKLERAIRSDTIFIQKKQPIQGKQCSWGTIKKGVTYIFEIVIINQTDTIQEVNVFGNTGDFYPLPKHAMIKPMNFGKIYTVLRKPGSTGPVTRLAVLHANEQTVILVYKGVLK